MFADEGSEWSDEAVVKMIDGLADPVICFMPDGLVLYSNRSHSRMYGREWGSLVGTDMADLFPREHREALRQTLAQMESMTPENRTVITWTELWPGDVAVLHEWTNTAQFDEDGRVAGILAVGRDVTTQTLEAARNAHEARHDALTGLLNRHGIESHLTRRWAGHDPADLTIVYLDLDGFKDVNDRYGHAAGDAILIAVGDALSTTVRPEDIVGRLGGDEFVVLLNGARDPDLAAARISRVEESLAALEHPVGVSWGVAVPRPGEPWARTVDRADALMRADKSRRRTERVASRAC